jgi:hypothetical protein
MSQVKGLKCDSSDNNGMIDIVFEVYIGSLMGDSQINRVYM